MAKKSGSFQILCLICILHALPFFKFQATSSAFLITGGRKGRVLLTRALYEEASVWDQRIEQLIQYNLTFGTVNVPTIDYYSADNAQWKPLAFWIKKVRFQRTTLSEERYQQLTDMGLTWAGSKEEKEDRRWNEMYLRLQSYKEKYGHCLVKNKWEHDKQLGLWVSKQRSMKKRRLLKEEREQKLNDLEFVWQVCNRQTRSKLTVYDKQWLARYRDLKRFQHGTLFFTLSICFILFESLR